MNTTNKLMTRLTEFELTKYHWYLALPRSRDHRRYDYDSSPNPLNPKTLKRKPQTQRKR